MGRIQRFEDLVAWQMAREITKAVYAMTHDGAFARDYGLVDQIRRASVSVMSNIAEGFERETNPDRLRFYSIAKGSCAELRSQLYVALDAGYLSEANFAAAQAKAEELGRVIGGLRAAVSRSIQQRGAAVSPKTVNGAPG